jgi:uncharacterized protein
VIYNVAQLLKAPVGTAQRAPLDNNDELELEENEARLAGPVTGQVRMHRTNQGIFVDGVAEVPVELQCTRCLKTFTETFPVPIRELFYPTIDVETGVPVLPPENDDLSFPIDHNHVLDLREAIRQNLLLAMPIKTLCKEDCAGLCPECGKDWNEGPCDCETMVDDDRFSALRQLLEQSEL